MLRLSPGLSHASSSPPPTVLMRCTVVTFESMPLPLRETTSSLSQAMSFTVAPGVLAYSGAEVAGWAAVAPADKLFQSLSFTFGNHLYLQRVCQVDDGSDNRSRARVGGHGLDERLVDFQLIN